MPGSQSQQHPVPLKGLMGEGLHLTDQGCTVFVFTWTFKPHEG